MSKNWDVIIDGKGYNFGTKKVRIGGVEYEQKDNEYPLEVIVENSDMMIMLEKHCDIPLIQRKTNPKTGEHIAKISVDFHGGWTEQVRRLCDQKNTRTIIFIAENPETSQLEIPTEEPETVRHWLLANEYRDMCYRHNKAFEEMAIYKYYQVIESPDRDIAKIEVTAVSDEPYTRVCYESATVNEFTLPEIDDAAAQQHYETMRKSNPPQTPPTEIYIGETIKTNLKDFAKSLEVETPNSEPKPEKEDTKKVIPFGHELVGRKDVDHKTAEPNQEKKTYKKTG